MNDQPPELGTVVLSRAGRDAGRYFVVVGLVDTQYVLIADGELRKLGSPKKKKLKHLDTKPTKLPVVREKQDKGIALLDAELRKGLEALGYTANDKALDRK